MNTAVLGARLAELRERAGLTRKALARRADVGAATVWRIERGQADPRLEVALALAAALGVTLDEWAGG